MSKFLKFLVGLILVVFIACGAALIVPQFVGNIDTIIVQQGMISNKTIGSAIYAQKEAAADIQVGDKIVDMDTDSLYVHEVVAFDYGTNMAQVTGGPVTTVRLGDAYTRAVVIVPLIGYLTIATQSLPGLILLGLLLALVIVLFIVSEALRRSDDDDDDDDIFGGKRDPYKDSEEDDRFYRELAEKKRQTESLKEVADALPQPTPPAGLFSDDTGNDAAADKAAWDRQTPEDGMLELSHSVPPVEEPAFGKEEKPLGTGELPDVQAALEAALENQQLNRYEHPQGNAVQAGESVLSLEDAGIPDEVNEIELAMPVHTAEELMSKAYASGLEPKMRKDKSGVTFIDYSDCL